MREYFYSVSVCAMLTLSTAAQAAPDGFTETITFSRYEIVGQLTPKNRDGKIQNTVLVAASNPRSGIWIISSEKINSITARVRTGTLSQCSRITESDRQTITNQVLPLLVQLPLIEATLMSENGPSELNLEKVRSIKVMSRFLNSVDEDAPWYTCK